MGVMQARHRILMAQPHIVTPASAAVQNFSTDLSAPLKKCMVSVEAVQGGTGDPSPENICPITGWTGAKVNRTGKNLLPIPTETVTLLSGVVVSASEGKLQITGTGNSYGTYNIDLPYAIPAGTRMVLNGNVTGNGVVSYRVRNIERNTYEQINLNTPKSIRYDVNRFQVAVNPNAEYSYTIENIQLEIGSTATAYEPYQGDTYDIEFPSEAGTVYGGSLDVTNGVLTVDRAMVDMGTLVYNKTLSPSASGGNVFSVNVSNVGYGMARRERNAPNTMLSDVYETAQSTIWWVSDIPDLTMSVNVSVLYIADSRYEDATSFKTSVSGVQLVYELATPMTYQLTPQEVRTLLGQNNLWADTGDVAVTYKADTKLYIDNKITQAIAAAMNS